MLRSEERALRRMSFFFSFLREEGQKYDPCLVVYPKAAFFFFFSSLSWFGWDIFSTHAHAHVHGVENIGTLNRRVYSGPYSCCLKHGVMTPYFFSLLRVCVLRGPSLWSSQISGFSCQQARCCWYARCSLCDDAQVAVWLPPWLSWWYLSIHDCGYVLFGCVSPSRVVPFYRRCGEAGAMGADAILGF